MNTIELREARISQLEIGDEFDLPTGTYTFAGPTSRVMGNYSFPAWKFERDGAIAYRARWL